MTEQGFYFVIVPIIRSEPINEKTSDHTFFITVFNPLCGQEGEIGLKTLFHILLFRFMLPVASLVKARQHGTAPVQQLSSCIEPSK